MLSAKRGDMAALELLVRKHRSPIVHYVNRIVRDPAIAEELAQEAFLRVHIHRRRYRAKAKFTSWLYNIANHLALNWLRDHGRERPPQGGGLPHAATLELVAPTMSIEKRLVLQVKLDEVRRAVAELPERQRTVVEMHQFAELNCEHIGEMLGCSHQAVRSLLCRAYSTLRVRLAHVA